MNKSDLPEERRKRLAIEEAIRRDTLSKAARDHLNRHGLGRPPIMPFAVAAGLLTAVITAVFFPPNYVPVLINTLLAGGVVSAFFGLVINYGITPIIDSIMLGWVLNQQKSQAQINRWIKTATLIMALLTLAALVLTGAWVGRQTNAHESLFIWNWIGEALR